MIQSISVNGEVHQIDYTTLANKPTIPVIPSVTSADQGKVLAVNSSGEWQPESLDIPEPVDPLPTVTSADQGKVLAVNSSGEWQPESLDIPDPLPTVTSADQGKVLAVDSNGEWSAESLDIPEAIPSASTGGTGAALVVKNGSWAISSSLTEVRLIQTNNRVSNLEYGTADTMGAVRDLGDTCNDLSAICEALRSEVNSLKTRVYILEHGDGSTASSISGDKLSLVGTNAVVNGEKLSVTGSGFTVNGEKLSITEEV